MIVIVIVLALAVLGLGGWALWLWSHPREVAGPDRIVHIQGPERTREIEVVREVEVPVPGPETIKKVSVVEYVSADDVPIAAVAGSQFSDPRALPDVPGALPDSAVDGVRLGQLTVRAGAVRGTSGRIDASLRRQVAEISVLGMLVPPALLSVVASGRRGAQFGQIGAVQATRSIHVKLAARAAELDRLWDQAAAGDTDAERRLDTLLREVTGSLTDELDAAARRRDATADTMATQLTCVLSRMGRQHGDTPVREHLAFGVGPGPVLRAGREAGWLPVTASTGRDGDYLPHHKPATWSGRAQTSPGDLLVLCTATTAKLLDRAADQLRADWAAPPSFVGFLYQLGLAVNVLSEDRAAVCLWEGDAGAFG
jgi:hypothetical protein